MVKVAIVVLTCNNSICLKKVLDKNLHFYLERNCDVYIYDSSSDNCTLELIKNEYNMKAVYYKQLDYSIHSNEKIYQAYKEIECEYIWVVRDKTWYGHNLLSQVFSLIDSGKDIINIRLPAKMQYKIVEQRDVYQFAYKANLLITYGSTIVNRSRILKVVDWDYYINKYLRGKAINFSHVGIILEQADKLHDFDGAQIDIPKDQWNSVIETSTWFDDVIRVWGCGWVSFVDIISSFFGIDDEKSEYLIHAPRDRFNEIQMLIYKLAGVYDIEKYNEYKYYLHRINAISFERMRKIAQYSDMEVLAKIRNALFENIETTYKRYKEFIIYGAGRVGRRTAKVMEFLGLPIKGFMVTFLNDNDFCEGYKVYEYDSYVFSDTEGIVLGLGAINSKVVTEKLIHDGMSDKICYGIDFSDIVYDLLINRSVGLS